MNLTRFVALLAAPLLLGGCVSFSPKSIGALPQSITPAWRGPVNVISMKVEGGASTLYANGQAVEIDLNDFSENLAGLVRDSLAQSGTPTAPEAPTLAVRVIYLDYLFQGPCLVDYTVTLGDGMVFGLQGSGGKGGLNASCRRALEAAVSQIVAHPRTVEYLGGS